jgi:peroxiredoxin
MGPYNENDMLKRSIAALFAASLLAAGLPPFELRDTSGAVHRPAEWRDKRAVVLFFVMTDCPLANGYVPEMNRIRADYVAKGVAVYAVQTDNTISDADVRKYAQDFGYTFPVLHDPRLTLARFTSATVSPEVAVLSPAGEVLYLGRIDNKVEDIIKPRYAATEPELRNALDSVLAGKAPKAARTRAVGCSISLETP